uniref:Uncharacterized protein n=1 Tax=Anguilla anguilla TaxID=7936 RepID=A0A0E9P957_ANGAN
MHQAVSILYFTANTPPLKTFTHLTMPIKNSKTYGIQQDI